MNESTPSIRRNALRTALYGALTIAALGATSAPAFAFDLDTITLSDPAVKTIDRDESTDARVQQVSVSATIAADAEALKYPSGVALLKEKVVQAAQQACHEADPFDDDDRCVVDAVKAAKPEIKAAVAQARANG